jgi:glycosyltransferase involved in cell wall biosynthesis
MHYDIICLSHRRWDSVPQRPHQLMSRAGQRRKVLFVEPALRGEWTVPSMSLRIDEGAPAIATPLLPDTMPVGEAAPAQRDMLRSVIESLGMRHYVLWSYPAAMDDFAAALDPVARIHDATPDCAPVLEISAVEQRRETALARLADALFVDDSGLDHSRRQSHPNVHYLPSPVDHAHFAAARGWDAEPADQADIPHPRAGFFGTVDDDLALELLAEVAALRPEMHFVMVGSIAERDAATLPRGTNIHWLGSRPYADLPGYLAGWDVGILPFRRTEATRFLMPAQIHQYLAGGKPLVSTALREVVREYGVHGLVRVADRADAFARALDAALSEDHAAHRRAADRLLARTLSWDHVWAAMDHQVLRMLVGRRRIADARAARLVAQANIQPLSA